MNWEWYDSRVFREDVHRNNGINDTDIGRCHNHHLFASRDLIMGWTGIYHTSSLKDIKNTFNKLLNFSNNQMTLRTVQDSLRFGTYYAAVERTLHNDTREPVVFAIIILWRYDKKNGMLWYKDMDESAGPYQVGGCPKSLISKLTETTSVYAKTWRETVLSLYTSNKR